ncbi:MAG: ABC transporter ATP-binding protein [Fusobacteriaceae bacterium]
MNDKVLLEIRNLKKYFPVKKKMFEKEQKWVKANDGVSFKLKKGETLGLVGESGCGKSTLGRTLLKLSEVTSGEIIFNDVNITNLTTKEMIKYRKNMQIIFQDPYSSLNPRMTVGQIVGEPLIEHGLFPKKNEEYKKEVEKILEMCGLADYHVNRFPHQFSGGQRQRIGIARALALRPSFIVCDEAVSALDISIQSQIINLLMKLQKELDLSYLFISHDLSVVKHISDRVGVMYLGNLVEISSKKSLFDNPLHPYTKSLLSSIPSIDPTKKKKKIYLKGEIPSNINPPKGCKFHNRCPVVKEICKNEIPELREIEKEHFVACHGI